MKKIACLVLGAALLLPGMAFAELPMPGPSAKRSMAKGDLELGVSASLENTETTIDTGFGPATTSESDSATVTLGVGYFLTDIWQLSGFLSQSVDEQEGSEKNSSGLLGLGTDFNFGRASWSVRPFVGVSYTAGLGDFETDFAEGHAGIKIFPKERIAIEIQLQRLEALDDEFDIAITKLEVGLNVYF